MARIHRYMLIGMVCLLGMGGVVAPTVGADTPNALATADLTLDQIPRVELPGIDLAAVQLEDEVRADAGLAPRFAIPHEVHITPATHGTWQDTGGDERLWQLRLSSPGALSLNLGFTAYYMPEGGALRIFATDGSYELLPFTAEDNEEHGELWTPVVLSDDLIVEVIVPTKAQEELTLELSVINHGYRFFGEVFEETAGDRSGYCNIDVICPEGDDWRDEIPSVGVISTGGSTFCTGFMVNNTAQDQTPYFMTAYHCGINSGNASSMVVYWNFESPICGQQGGGSLSQYQTGSYYRASYSSSDFTLVELDDDPNPAHNVSFAGWSRSSANPTSAVAIHHPSTDEKSISFEYDACTTTTYLQTSQPGDGTHIRVTDWDEGTTEPGSSGSPLFDQNHHVVGQLHGGYAACGNNESDWYGRFSVSWTHGLSSYLDPGSTGATSVDTLVPGADGLKVTPSDGLDSAGDPGGPFSPSSKQYTLENQGSSGFNYSVTKSASWVSITNSSGYLPGQGSTTVTVSVNSNANSLGVGSYNDLVNFINTTNHTGDTSRQVSLQVGGPSRLYYFPLDTNPGWTTQGLWAYGHPTGGGGQYGESDPSNGYTGSNVYGYNLNGDYENDLAERHLTSTALDCSEATGVTLKFRRWLGVERSQYDHAYVRVSNNGSSWTTIWENGEETTDSSWQLQEFDISAVADNQATVYLRWTMGTTDGSWQYCGWNLDDLEIWGLTSTPDPLHIVSSDPPDGIIDARRDINPDSLVEQGWSSVEITFDGNAEELGIASFDLDEVCNAGNCDGVPPNVTSVSGAGDVVTVSLNRPIDPKAWTVISYVDGDAGDVVRLGYLPADADASGSSTANDIVAVVDMVNESIAGGSPPMYRGDIDRSGAVAVNDITELIDLLNGAGAYDAYFDVTLPALP